ncbi:MAG: DUF488 family protein [Deltaproteobacteria bacterium]|nr:DUF488 family protein [Deltaproteobacteria bacterium]
MAVFHKSIYDPIETKQDGHRLLVTRYWPRGIKKSAVDSWERELGAPVQLIHKKKSGKLTKGELKRLYIAALDREALERAVVLARKGTVTLLCTCRDELCHRVVLADILERKLRRKKAVRA